MSMWIRNFRKQGVFKYMYKYVLQMAKKFNVKAVRLMVAHENTGPQTVYEKAGMIRGDFQGRFWQVKFLFSQ